MAHPHRSGAPSDARRSEADAPCINAHRLRNGPAAAEAPKPPERQGFKLPPPERAGRKSLRPRQGRRSSVGAQRDPSRGRRDLTSLRSGLQPGYAGESASSRFPRPGIVSTARTTSIAFLARALAEHALRKREKFPRQIRVAGRIEHIARRNRMLAFSTVPFCSVTSTLAPIFSSESAASARIDNFCLSASAAVLETRRLEIRHLDVAVDERPRHQVGNAVIRVLAGLDLFRIGGLLPVGEIAQTTVMLAISPEPGCRFWISRAAAIGAWAVPTQGHSLMQLLRIWKPPDAGAAASRRTRPQTIFAIRIGLQNGQRIGEAGAGEQRGEYPLRAAIGSADPLAG